MTATTPWERRKTAVGAWFVPPVVVPMFFVIPIGLYAIFRAPV